MNTTEIHPTHASETSLAVATVIPINEAEAIISPFWAWSVSDFKHWHFQPGEGSGAEVSEPWEHVAYSWTQPPHQGPAVTLVRKAQIDCTGYDQLILRIQLPQGAVMRLRVESDRGVREQTFTDDSTLPREHALALDGATCLSRVTIEIEAGTCRAGTGCIFWLGLASTTMLERYHARWDHLRRTDWGEKHLEPTDFAPAFTPAHGIFLTPDTLEQLRATVAQPDGLNIFHKIRDDILANDYCPESDISDYPGAWFETITRDRDSQRLSRLIGGITAGPGSRAALVGLVLKDTRLLRLAARYALSIAACENWTVGFTCNFHGCEFETRAFLATFMGWEIAAIADLAGEMFSYWGKEYLQRRLAEKTLGEANYVSWRWDYLHTCNQLALISPGRIGASVVLERTWPRLCPYTDLAIAELNRSMESIVLADGSFVEGPGYLTGSLATAIPAYILYARARGLTTTEVLPMALRRTADYIEAFMATDESTDYLATNECGEDVSRTNLSSAALLAAALPDTHWVSVYRKLRTRTPDAPTDLKYLSMVTGIPETEPPRRAFVHLHEGGFMSSLRSLAGESVRIFIMGNKANAGHCHEDKGSFILEFAGETFAMDSNCYRYDSVFVDVLKQCDRHNMLVPFGAGDERPRPKNPISADVKPEGRGDETCFEGSIDATPGWDGYYQRWQRRWSSPTPDVLEIHDEYALERGEGVEFLWNTRLPIRLEGEIAVVTGKRGQARITWSAGCSARIEALPSPPGRAHNRLVIRREGKSGTLSVRVALECIGKG